jgi:hypothetical protein
VGFEDGAGWEEFRALPNETVKDLQGMVNFIKQSAWNSQRIITTVASRE